MEDPRSGSASRMTRLWGMSFCLKYSIRSEIVKWIHARLLTLKVFDAIVCAVVLPSLWVVPFDSKPVAWLVSYRTDIANSARLILETQSLTDVVFFSSHVTDIRSSMTGRESKYGLKDRVLHKIL